MAVTRRQFMKVSAAGLAASSVGALGFVGAGEGLAAGVRPYQNAGLYDPKGVNGTHVMYVLQHADKPSLYAGLPDNPHISPLVGIWKGVMKPLSLAAIAFAGAFGFLHYVTKGPNTVTEHDEEKAAELAGTDRAGSDRA